MCGRFTFHADTDTVQAMLNLGPIHTETGPSFNIAPTHSVLTVVQRDGVNNLERMQWGLIPAWSKDPKIGSKMINARAETLDEKPSFKRLLKSQRCLILADGFYEWRQGIGKKKTPLHIRLKSGQPFAFAGLYDTWRPPQGDPLTSCTIITTAANELMAAFHHRMPVILYREDYTRWLDPSFDDIEALVSSLKQYPADEMIAYAVSDEVNSPQHNTPRLIEAVPA